MDLVSRVTVMATAWDIQVMDMDMAFRSGSPDQTFLKRVRT